MIDHIITFLGLGQGFLITMLVATLLILVLLSATWEPGNFVEDSDQ